MILYNILFGSYKSVILHVHIHASNMKTVYHKYSITTDLELIEVASINSVSHIPIVIVRSLDRLILNFAQLIIKLKPLLSCKKNRRNCHETIVSIGLMDK